MRRSRKKVESFIKACGFDSGKLNWVNDSSFYDEHGCNGYLFKDTEEATKSILKGENRQNAIDYVSGALNDEDWVNLLVYGNNDIDTETARKLVADKEWGILVDIIVEKCGATFFLSDYSGSYYYLD